MKEEPLLGMKTAMRLSSCEILLRSQLIQERVKVRSVEEG